MPKSDDLANDAGKQRLHSQTFTCPCCQVSECTHISYVDAETLNIGSEPGCVFVSIAVDGQICCSHLEFVTVTEEVIEVYTPKGQPN